VLAQRERSTPSRHFLDATPDASEVELDVPWGCARRHGRQLLPTIDRHDGFYYAAAAQGRRLRPGVELRRTRRTSRETTVFPLILFRCPTYQRLDCRIECGRGAHRVGIRNRRIDAFEADHEAVATALAGTQHAAAAGASQQGGNDRRRKRCNAEKFGEYTARLVRLLVWQYEQRLAGMQRTQQLRHTGTRGRREPGTGARTPGEGSRCQCALTCLTIQRDHRTTRSHELPQHLPVAEVRHQHQYALARRLRTFQVLESLDGE
jgi:hypothetical protein